MATFTAPQDFAERVLAEPVEFEVWAENWPALDLFLRVQTQWRIGGMGGCFGLDYTAVEAAMRMIKADKTEELFDKIQVMEFAALPELNKKRD